MSFEVKETSRFKRHIRTLDKRLGLKMSDVKEVVLELREVRQILEDTGTLPDGYDLHELQKEPWTGYMEFHLLDNVLIVYADVTAKREIRLTGIYNHELLSQGRLD